MGDAVGAYEVLRRVSIFQDVAANRIRRLAQQATERTLDVGDHLWGRGTRADGLAVVAEGRLEIARSVGPRRLVYRWVWPGEVVGFGRVSGEWHAADVVAPIPSRVLCVSAQAIRTHVEGQRGFCRALVALQSQWIADLWEQIELERCASLKERILHWLEKLARAHGSTRVPITRKSLGELCGANATNVSRALGRLFDDGDATGGRGWVGPVD